MQEEEEAIICVQRLHHNDHNNKSKERPWIIKLSIKN
jgi:hypothetical protein